MSVSSKERMEAANYAYRLLYYRERSRSEMASRLGRRGYAPSVIKDVIGDLEKKRLLDDGRFAALLIRDIMRTRPSGLYFIRSKLMRYGVDRKVADKAISDIESEYDEFSAALNAAEKRKAGMRGVNKEKAKKRIYDFLLRRGFSKDVVYKILGRLFS